MKMAVAQIGARMHYAVPRIFYQSQKLEQLYTDICAVKGWPRLFSIFPPSIRPSGIKSLLGRVPEGIPAERITAFNWLGFEYARRIKAASTRSEATAAHLWSADRFSELILKHGLGEADTIYGFNVGCTILYRKAKQAGLKVVMEQFIAPRWIEQRLLDEELSDASEWGKIEHDKLIDEVVQREKEAWDLSDLILCGSEFVRQGVVAEGGPAQKCIVVPYGIELSKFEVSEGSKCGIDGPLRILFVGSVGYRKGVRYLLDAMKQLESLPVRCRIVGNWQVSSDVLRRCVPSNVELVGQIPRTEIMREYARADVFCLPSLCEGSATVIYEALAAGLPVITTHNSGSIVRDGEEGFIVPIKEASAIADCIKSLILDRELLRTMSIKALERSLVGSIEAKLTLLWK